MTHSHGESQSTTGQWSSTPGSGLEPLAVQWGEPDSSQRSQIAQILEETGVFRPDEVDVALEVFDDYCEAPDADYWAVGAFAGPDELAGFAFFGATPCTLGCWDLYWIAVKPEFQGAGLGRGLLERVERQLEGAGARMCLIETSSRSDYAATRRFYGACGYGEVARVPDFYSEGDDRVIYAKRFAGPKSPSKRGVSTEK